jgi:hypothetical protein
LFHWELTCRDFFNYGLKATRIKPAGKAPNASGAG